MAKLHRSGRYQRAGLKSGARSKRGIKVHRRSVKVRTTNTASSQSVTPTGAARVIRPVKTPLRRMTGKGNGNVQSF